MQRVICPSPNLYLCALISSLLSPYSAAQQSTTDVATTAPPIEKVTVTGSHIKRIQAEGPAPLEVITADDIKASGLDTLTEVLQSLTSVSGGYLDNVVAGLTRSATTVNLRGIGDNRTLVLVDGVRVSKFPGSISGNRNSFDTDSLPSAAVEKIEILHGGASAIYGSDAMGGVMNVILKKSYKGTVFKTKYGDTQHGGRSIKGFSLTKGFTLADTDNLVVFEHQSIEAMLKKQRKLTRGHGIFRDQWYLSNSAAVRDYDKVFHQHTINVPDKEECLALFADKAKYVPGFWDGKVYPEEIEKYQAGGGDPFSDEGIAHLKQFGLRKTAYKCRYDRLTDNNSLTPNKKRYNLTWVNTKDLGSGWQWQNTYTYYQKKSDQSQGVRHSSITLYRDATSGALSTDKDAFDHPNKFAVYRAYKELGELHQLPKNKAWNWTSSISGYWRDYDINLVAAYGEATRFLRGTNYQAEDSFFQALTLDPKDPNRGKSKWYPLDKLEGDLLELVRADKITRSYAYATNLSATLSGELMQDFFGNGSLDFAVLVDVNAEAYNDINIEPEGKTIGVGGSDGDGKRKRYAAAAEFSVPLLPDNQLSSNMALRYDHYDDDSSVGGAFTPQIDFALRPTPSLLARARYAKTFRAPDLQRITSRMTQLYGSTGSLIKGQLPFYDRETDNFETISSGSLSLKEETGQTWNLGVVYEITQGLTANLDYWNVELDGAVKSISTGYMLRADQFDSFNRTGEAQRCEDLAGPGFILGESRLTGSDGVVRDYLDVKCTRVGSINASVQDSRGVDFGIKYSLPTALGNFRFSTNGTYLAYRKTQDLADSEIRNAVEDFYDPQWRINTRLSWHMKEWSAALSWYYIGSMRGEARNVSLRDPNTFIALRDENNKLITAQSIKQSYGIYHKLNLTAVYGGFSNLKLGLGILNLLDEDPVTNPLYTRRYPFYRTSSGQSLYGREFYVNAEYKF